MKAKEEIVDPDALWDAMMKCRKGVSWKPSVKHFTLNGIEETLSMSKALQDGTWKNGAPKPIMITYPKKREGLSIPFRDRVYQRSVNDLVLYPEITKRFILDNCACQKGKGPDFARKRLKQHLWSFYCHYGLNGWVVQTDIHGYYPNMSHEAVKKHFRRYLSDEIYQMVCDVLDTQYTGDIGYNPGSQMVQIAGISLLDPMDHYIKEWMHARHYIRYMDDTWTLTHDHKHAERCLEALKSYIEGLGLTFNVKKTHIIPLREGFEFLGFRYRMTETGKIIMTLNSQNVHHERKKLQRMAIRVQKGLMTQEKMDECYASWKEHASHGNSYNLLKRTDQYYQTLKGERNEVQRSRNVTAGGQRVCQSQSR